MNVRRLVGSLLTTTLAAAALSVVATASPAAAATTTKIVASSGSSWLTYSSYRSQPGAPAVGDTIYFSVNVVATDGTDDPYEGTVTVQRQLRGSSAWATIATSSYAGYYGSTKAVSNASYRVLYSGGTGYGGDAWSASSSAKSVSVQRKLSITPKSGRKLGLAVKVAPKGKVKMAVLKKHGKKWKKFKSVKTSRAGKAFVKLPAPARGKKFYWKIQIKPSSRFALTQSTTYYTTKY